MFPDHWSFLLGELALYSFVVLVATGVYLTFFFHPGTEIVRYDGSYEPLRGVEMTEAYRSAVELSFDVRAGLVMRQIHHWAALLFIAAIVVHLMRIFFTGAFRRPRELNWMIGVTLLILAIFNGFAGYSLLDDQLSGTGLRIAYSITLSIPLAGTWLASFLFGGEFPGPDIINRLYVIHILLLPAIIAALIGAHLFLVVRHKHTQFAGKGRTEDNVVGEAVWPSFAFKSIGLMLLVAGLLAALGGLAQINPIWLYGPFDPAEVELRLPTRLVHGLARRRAPPLPAVGDPRLRLRGPRAVLPRGAARRHHLRPPLRVAGAGGAVHRRPPPAPPARPAPRPPGAHVARRRDAQLLHGAHAGRLERRDRHHVRPVGQRGASSPSACCPSCSRPSPPGSPTGSATTSRPATSPTASQPPERPRIRTELFRFWEWRRRKRAQPATD